MQHSIGDAVCFQHFGGVASCIDFKAHLLESFSDWNNAGFAFIIAAHTDKHAAASWWNRKLRRLQRLAECVTEVFADAGNFAGTKHFNAQNRVCTA